jgi:hypothetical protein
VGDIDGDGYADVAAPTVHGVAVLYGGADGLGTGRSEQLWSRESAGVPGDDSGSGGLPQLGDLNGDGRSDLAFSEDDHVTVIYGSSSGLPSSGAQDFAKTTPGVRGHREPADRFGAAIAAGDLNRNGRDDLIIGNPGGSYQKAGATSPTRQRGEISILAGRSPRVTARGGLLVHARDPGLPNGAGHGNQWANALQVGRYGYGSGRDIVVGGVSNCTVIPTARGRNLTLRERHAVALKLPNNWRCVVLPRY